MTQQDWAISRFTGRCARSGRNLTEGDEFVSVIIAEGDELRRLDYSAAEWAGAPDGALGFFRGRVPTKAKPKRSAVDESSLFDFFDRLRDEVDAARLRFRFVLALMLLRKRVLRFESSERTELGEVWVLRSPRDGCSHRVINPELTDEEARQASEQLAVLLGVSDEPERREVVKGPPSASAEAGGVHVPA